MPDRTLGPGRWVLRLLGWVLIVLMVATGITATVYAYTGANAVKALRTSSSRAECRTRIINEEEDAFRHRIGRLLLYVQNGNRAKAIEIATAIDAETLTQRKIDVHCPAPLAKGTPTHKETP